MKHPSEAETLQQKLRTVHVDQIYSGNKEFDKPTSQKLFQILVSTMSIAGTATIGLGVFLAFKIIRPKLALSVTSGGGILIPVLWLGRR